ncbi:pantothenate synthetase [Mycobacterium conspicuum]|nr:pantothenate synthetase [Mycobacterium conspicuum]
MARELDASDWTKTSGCPGWSARDVLSHMACSFWLAVDPAMLPDPAALPAERAADLYVESRRDMTHEQIVADYDSVSAKGLEVLAALQEQDAQIVEVPLGDVGTYPAPLIANAFAFEHFVHLRYDLLAPGGPLSGEAPSDELRLAPTLDWIEAALPQQNAALLARMGNAVEIDLDGSAGRKIRIGGAEVAARITCGAEAFVQWVTQRGTWEALGVHAEGDRSIQEIARQFRVF